MTEKLREYFDDMVVFKDLKTTVYFPRLAYHHLLAIGF